MKKLILICVIMPLVSCVHQKIVPVEDRQVQVVHEVDLTKDQIFDKTLEWMALTFNDSKAVIELKDRENGKIIGKGISRFGIMGSTHSYVVIVDIKEKKYRATFKDFIVSQSGSEINGPPFLEQVLEKMKYLESSLALHIKKAKEDW